jgi:hypothetical protein
VLLLALPLLLQLQWHLPCQLLRSLVLLLLPLLPLLPVQLP